MIDNYGIDELMKKVCKSISFTWKNDRFLMENDVNERSIANKLAGYLQEEFPEWNVDSEYNRVPHDVKRRANKKVFLPDIIVHKRDTEKNLIMVEVKKTNGRYNDEEERLIETTTKASYNYKLGVYVTFKVLDGSNEPPTVKFYSEGKEIK